MNLSVVVREVSFKNIRLHMKVAQARPRAARAFEMPRFHNVVRTGTVLRYPLRMLARRCRATFFFRMELTVRIDA